MEGREGKEEENSRLERNKNRNRKKSHFTARMIITEMRRNLLTIRFAFKENDGEQIIEQKRCHNYI